MKRPFGLLGPDYGPFLYASVGDEGNGMVLSVLSMLARRDLDPWKEAAELAALPIDAATRRLASLIAGLPGMAGRPEVGGTANRLVVLLPKQTHSTTPPGETVIGDTLGLTKSSILIWMVVMGVIVGTQAVQASRQPPAQTKQETVPAATQPAASAEPPLNSGP
jgi:hypothetical protein